MILDNCQQIGGGSTKSNLWPVLSESRENNRSKVWDTSSRIFSFDKVNLILNYNFLFQGWNIKNWFQRKVLKNRSNYGIYSNVISFNHSFNNFSDAHASLNENNSWHSVIISARKDLQSSVYSVLGPRNPQANVGVTVFAIS